MQYTPRFQGSTITCFPVDFEKSNRFFLPPDAGQVSVCSVRCCPTPQSIFPCAQRLQLPAPRHDPQMAWKCVEMVHFWGIRRWRNSASVTGQGSWFGKQLVHLFMRGVRLVRTGGQRRYLLGIAVHSDYTSGSFVYYMNCCPG